jgi:hypothetical protein
MQKAYRQSAAFAKRLVRSSQYSRWLGVRVLAQERCPVGQGTFDEGQPEDTLIVVKGRGNDRHDFHGPAAIACGRNRPHIRAEPINTAESPNAARQDSSILNSPCQPMAVAAALPARL